MGNPGLDIEGDSPTKRATVIALLVICATASCAAAMEPVGKKSVTTTWLPDPFPNTAPKALDRQAITEVDTPMRTPSVLLGVYDVENDPLTAASSGQPAHGSAVLNRDGTFGYTPQPGYVGPDEFSFMLSDGRGGESTATMHVSVIRPTGQWATTSFTGLAEVQAGGWPIEHGRSATVPRVVDWDGDGKLDLLVGAAGAVWLYRNVGTPSAPRFAGGVRVQVGWARIDMPGMPFNQTFSVPTELTLRTTDDGIRMFASPIKEIEQLRKPNPKTVPNQELTAAAPAVEFDVAGQLFDIVVTLRKGTAAQVLLRFGENSVTYDFGTQELEDMPLKMMDDKVTFRVLVDRPMYEVVGGDGICFKTNARRDMGKPLGRISVAAQGGSLTIASFTAHELNSAWKNR